MFFTARIGAAATGWSAVSGKAAVMAHLVGTGSFVGWAKALLRRAYAIRCVGRVGTPRRASRGRGFVHPTTDTCSTDQLGQSRKVMLFSFAYFSAESSISCLIIFGSFAPIQSLV